MTVIGRQRLDDEIARVRERLVAGREMLSSGVDPEGAPLGREARARLSDEIEELEGYLVDREGLELVLPDVVVADVLELGAEVPAIRVHRVGPAHNAQ